MADDHFHEIQLSGKQLVFLFMAATVVSVVIFLCGVLVGRGVRAGDAPRYFAGIPGVYPLGERGVPRTPRKEEHGVLFPQNGRQNRRLAENVFLPRFSLTARGRHHILYSSRNQTTR